MPEGATAAAAVLEPREPVLMCMRVCLEDELEALLTGREEALLLSAVTDKVFNCCCRSAGNEFQYVQAASRSWMGTGSYRAS